MWSGLGWNPDANRDRYSARLSAATSSATSTPTVSRKGLLALERNWRGPLATNAGVDTTLEQFQAMERTASPQVLANWRFQQALYRAYYDCLHRARLIYETRLESEAHGPSCGTRRALGSLLAMDRGRRRCSTAR